MLPIPRPKPSSITTLNQKNIPTPNPKLPNTTILTTNQQHARTIPKHQNYILSGTSIPKIPKASSINYYRTYQSDPTGTDLTRRFADFRGAVEFVPMDWCWIICNLVLHAILFREKGRHQLFTQQMDIPNGSIHYHRGVKRIIRQTSDGDSRCHDRPSLVQYLPMYHHGNYPAVTLVSPQKTNNSFQMALEHCLYFALLMCSRLDIFLCADIPGFHDFYRIDGSTQQRTRNFHCRRTHFP